MLKPKKSVAHAFCRHFHGENGCTCASGKGASGVCSVFRVPIILANNDPTKLITSEEARIRYNIEHGTFFTMALK